ncbi:MAG: chorismate mutase [Lachnospiraceae bacterium]|nr:chorismate mutase [Lachnospiraceae bacterium]
MNLDNIRKEIDETDKEMFKLFERRMKLAGEVAASKLETGDCIYKPDREKAVIERFKSGAPDNMKWYYEAFIRKVMLISREYQYSIISESAENSIYGETNGSSEITLSFSYKYGWPDNIVVAIGDTGAAVTDFKKDGDIYTITLHNIESQKLKALLTLIECESDGSVYVS